MSSSSTNNSETIDPDNISRDQGNSEQSTADNATSIIPPTMNEPDAARYTGTISEESDMSSLTQAQLHELTQNMLDEVTSSRPLITEIVPIAILRAEYEGGSMSFVQQIDYLQGQGFTGIRRTRGDGDCFYRSLAFSYIERILTSSDQTLAVASALSTLDSTLQMLEVAGFQRLAFEDFYETLVSIIRQIFVPEPGGTTLTIPILLEAFQSPEVSSSVVVFMRLLTSATIRTDPDSYAPFLFHPETGEDIEPQEFCERYVEAMGKEADHVQITALAQALKINVYVAYLDGRSEDGKVSYVEFRNSPPEVGENPPILLYRPGHFDILERKSQDEST